MLKTSDLQEIASVSISIKRKWHYNLSYKEITLAITFKTKKRQLFKSLINNNSFLQFCQNPPIFHQGTHIKVSTIIATIWIYYCLHMDYKTVCLLFYYLQFPRWTECVMEHYIPPQCFKKDCKNTFSRMWGPGLIQMNCQTNGLNKILRHYPWAISILLPKAHFSLS